jgi:hypothetical protein
MIHPTSNRLWAWGGCLSDVVVELWGRRWGHRQRDVAGKRGGDVLTWWVPLYGPPAAVPSSVTIIIVVAHLRPSRLSFVIPIVHRRPHFFPNKVIV